MLKWFCHFLLQSYFPWWTHLSCGSVTISTENFIYAFVIKSSFFLGISCDDDGVKFERYLDVTCQQNSGICLYLLRLWKHDSSHELNVMFCLLVVKGPVKLFAGEIIMNNHLNIYSFMFYNIGLWCVVNIVLRL